VVPSPEALPKVPAASQGVDRLATSELAGHHSRPKQCAQLQSVRVNSTLRSGGSLRLISSRPGLTGLADGAVWRDGHIDLRAGAHVYRVLIPDY
jgi:hypothetical protein